MQYRFRQEKSGELCDIYDGEIYLKLSDFFACPYNISFTFNFDGAPKFKSSTMQIWPIQLIINELPPILRYSILHSCVCMLVCKTVIWPLHIIILCYDGLSLVQAPVIWAFTDIIHRSDYSIRVFCIHEFVCSIRIGFIAYFLTRLLNTQLFR